MLKYLIEVANSVFALAILLGFIVAYLRVFYKTWGKRIGLIGLCSGLLGSFIWCMIINNFRVRNSWRIGMSFNFIAFFSVIIGIILTILLKINKIKDRLKPKAIFVIEIITESFIALSMFSFMFNSMNTIWFYPALFYKADVGILSSEYLLNLLGFVIGVIIAIILGITTYKIGIVLEKKNFKNLLLTSTAIVVIVFDIYIFSKLVGSMVVRNIINSTALFEFSNFFENNKAWIAYLYLAIDISLCIFLWIKSYLVKEQYDNNAEHRKQKVVWRTAKRISVFFAFSLVIFTLCQTLFVDLITVVINETPLEEPILVENNNELWVPLNTVNDCHLHKFEYVTENGYKTRFIVILKQENTSNYGVGLDACEICGEAGYYENSDNQVVCKKCGVIMNTITIGMKGGCNPIIIDYDITDSYIIIPISEMVNNETKFSK